MNKYDTNDMTELIRKEKIYALEGAGGHLRAGVIARAGNNTDYSADFASVRSQEKASVSRVTGIPAENILFLNQVHGDSISLVEEYPSGDEPWHADADAIITSLPGLCAVIRTADCVPLVLFDREKKIMAAVHSGWKGSSLGIAGKALAAMIRRYGCKPGDVLAAIFPSIGPQSYEVKDDVARFFPCDLRVDSGKIFLDLWKNVADSLEAAGIPPVNIFNPRICTLINRGEFYTYRGGDSGRNLNFSFIA